MMSEQTPRSWARDLALWPFGGLRADAPPGVQVTTAVVRRIIENRSSYRRPVEGVIVGWGGEASVEEVLSGEVELDFVMLVDLEAYLESDLWPSRDELKSVMEPL